MKTRVAGSQWFSTGDGVAGFNQIKNTPFAASVLAIVTMSGKHMPTSLGFGPRNGPEDFSKFGYRVFRRKLFRTWYLFVDDVCIATGKAVCNDAVPGTEVQRWLDGRATPEERLALAAIGRKPPPGDEEPKPGECESPSASVQVDAVQTTQESGECASPPALEQLESIIEEETEEEVEERDSEVVSAICTV